MGFFRNLQVKGKLLLLILPLALAPLLGISLYSYDLAREQITADRVKLYLEELSRSLAETLRLTFLENCESTVAIGLNPELSRFLLNQPGASEQSALDWLDQMIFIHEVYDLIILFDDQGTIRLLNRGDRRLPLGPGIPDSARMKLLGRSLKGYQNGEWLKEVLQDGALSFIDWHPSEFLREIYLQADGRESSQQVALAQESIDPDIAELYTIGFAAPVLGSGAKPVGGILALMNWYYIQEILDKVEHRLEHQNLRSGYAFLFGPDRNTIIGHKYRLNRDDPDFTEPSHNNYGLRLVQDLNLTDLHEAAEQVAERTGDEPKAELQNSIEYDYPVGIAKISGLAAVDDPRLLQIQSYIGRPLGWVCGVGINNDEIFSTVEDLKRTLILAALFSAGLIVFLTYSVARQISNPVKQLTLRANRIKSGYYSERVSIDGRDEIGELASTFNDMAASLEERSQALMELNRDLERKVAQRTQAVEERSREVKHALQELKETQVQLIQSEKMASLGQLVAGIAHEIKNPLNFIYGNTDFLKKYIGQLKLLIRFLEARGPDQPLDREKLDDFKEEINYEFIVDDLDTLIRNFEEGAERIHAIISDLRTFSRLDADQLRSVDIREPIDLALNLLRNEYRDRIRIHRDYGQLPKVACDPGKISQVMMNLVVNACQSIEGEGDIWIRTFSRNGSAVIEVDDTGSGIEPEHLSKVFEPFFTTKPVGKGTGLGLSISYGIIQQHRGRIHVQSEKGKGTLFTVELPIQT